MNKDRTTSARPPGAQKIRWGLMTVATLGTVLVGVLLTAVWLLNDQQRIRRLAEGWLSEATGRQLVIAGDFNLQPGRIIMLTARDVSWANAAWSARTNMLTVGELQASLDMWKLLSGELHLENVSITQGQILLEWNESDAFNWQFSDSPTASEKKPDPLPVFLKTAQLKNFSVVFVHPNLVEDLMIDIAHAEHSEDADHRLVVQANAAMGERQLEVNSTLGPFPELIVGGAVNFDVSIRGPHAVLTGSGRFDWLTELENPSLSASLTAPKASEVLDALKLPASTRGPVDLQFNITSEANSVIADAGGIFGEHSLAANLVVKNLGTLEGFSLSADASGPSMGDAVAIAGKEGLPKTPYELKVKVHQTADGMELTKLSLITAGLTVNGKGLAKKLPALRDINLELDVSGENLGAVSQLFGTRLNTSLPFNVSARISSNGDNVPDSVNADVQVGKASAKLGGTLAESADLSGSRLSFSLATNDGTELTRIAGWELPPNVPLSVRGDLQVLEQRTLNLTKVAAQIATTQLGFDGKIQAGRQGTPVNGRLSFNSSNIAETGTLLRLDNLPDRSVKGTASVNFSPGRVQITDISLQGEDTTLSGMVELSGDSYSNVGFELEGSGPDLNRVMPVVKNYQAAKVPFDIKAKGRFSKTLIDIEALDATLGSAQFNTSGAVTLEPMLAASNVVIRGEGTRLADVGYVMGRPLRPSPFKFSASMAGDSGQLLIDDLKFESGESDLSGRIHIIDGNRPYFDLQLNSDDFDLDELWGNNEGNEKTAAVTTAAEPAEENALFWFADEPLPLDFTGSFNGKFDLQASRLHADNLMFTNLTANATLSDGVFDAQQITVDMPTGLIRAKGKLTPTTEGWQLRAEVQSNKTVLNFDESPLVAASELPRHAIDARLTATGRTAREMASTANGFVWILGGKGKTPSGQLGPLVGDFLTELISIINPFSKNEPYVTRDCQGLYFEITDGIFETAPAIVIQSDKLIIAAVGKIDLASETLDFTFETTPREGIGLSLNDLVSPYTRITGNLSNPKITLDPTGSLIEGGAAVYTAGLSILAKSLWKRWFRSGEACQKVAGEALKIRRARAPDAVPDLDEMIAGIE